jgi:hypothetical protein
MLHSLPTINGDGEMNAQVLEVGRLEESPDVEECAS